MNVAWDSDNEKVKQSQWILRLENVVVLPNLDEESESIETSLMPWNTRTSRYICGFSGRACELDVESGEKRSGNRKLVEKAILNITSAEELKLRSTNNSFWGTTGSTAAGSYNGRSAGKGGVRV